MGLQDNKDALSHHSGAHSTNRGAERGSRGGRGGHGGRGGRGGRGGHGAPFVPVGNAVACRFNMTCTRVSCFHIHQTPDGRSPAD